MCGEEQGKRYRNQQKIFQASLSLDDTFVTFQIFKHLITTVQRFLI